MITMHSKYGDIYLIGEIYSSEYFCNVQIKVAWHSKNYCPLKSTSYYPTPVRKG
jgi:hypothetical protein